MNLKAKLVDSKSFPNRSSSCCCTTFKEFEVTSTIKHRCFFSNGCTKHWCITLAQLIFAQYSTVSHCTSYMYLLLLVRILEVFFSSL